MDGDLKNYKGKVKNMAGKFEKLKNISRGRLFLDLTQVGGKVLELKADVEFTVSNDEYNYLCMACEGMFKNGDLKFIKGSADVDPIESENEMTFDEIEKMMELNLTQFKAKLKKVTSLDLLKDIRLKADEAGKPVKFMQAIDAKVKELADGSILI